MRLITLRNLSLTLIQITAQLMTSCFITKAMCGAECWTDHRLMICKLNLRILPPSRPQGKKPPKRLDISKLRVPQAKESLTNAVDSKLSSLSSISMDIESDWAAFRDSVYSAAKDEIGVARRKHRDWFDENNETSSVSCKKNINTTRLS